MYKVEEIYKVYESEFYIYLYLHLTCIFLNGLILLL